MEELIPTLIFALLGFVLLNAWQKERFTTEEQRWVAAAYLVHASASALILWSDDYTGGSDMTGYVAHGQQLTAAIYSDVLRFAPELVKVFFQREDAVIPGIESIADTSTGSMSAVTAVAMLPTNGSGYAAALLITLVGFTGKVALYRVFRQSFPEEYRIRLICAALLVPSVVCWSSGLIKEAVVVGPLGWITYQTHRAMHGAKLRPLLAIGASAVLIAMIKPYVLIPLTAASLVWVYWHRAVHGGEDGERPRIKVGYLVLGLAAAFAAIVALGYIFPSYSIDTFGEQSASYQERSDAAGGGSHIEMGDATQRTLAGQLLFAPEALASSLFRPFAFEVKNALMAVAALETTVLLIFVLRMFLTREGRRGLKVVWSSPLLVFAMVFVLLFGIAVGLVTANLGTLSRYRMPMMPFYVAFVVVVTKRRDEETERLELSPAAKADIFKPASEPV